MDHMCGASAASDETKVPEQRRVIQADLLKALKLRSQRGATAGWTANEVLPGLFLGDGAASQDLAQLRRYKITHILNVADDVPNSFPSEFRYCNLDVADFGQDRGISRVFATAVEFVGTALDGRDSAKLAESPDTTQATAVPPRKHNVLVHCAAGMNRSVCVTTAIVMKRNSVSLRDAWNVVLAARPGSCPLRGNLGELMAWELQETGSSTMSEDDFHLLRRRARRARRKKEAAQASIISDGAAHPP